MTRAMDNLQVFTTARAVEESEAIAGVVSVFGEAL